MPVSDILKLADPPLTAQQIADLALEQDQARRRAIAAHDDNAALWATVERDRLCRAMPR